MAFVVMLLTARMYDSIVEVKGWRSPTGGISGLPLFLLCEDSNHGSASGAFLVGDVGTEKAVSHQEAWDDDTCTDAPTSEDTSVNSRDMLGTQRKPQPKAKSSAVKKDCTFQPDVSSSRKTTERMLSARGPRQPVHIRVGDGAGEAMRLMREAEASLDNDCTFQPLMAAAGSAAARGKWTMGFELLSEQLYDIGVGLQIERPPS